MKLLIPVLCGPLFYFTTGAAQIELRGRVLDSDSRNPVPNATICVLETDLCTESNSRGEFAIFFDADSGYEILTIVVIEPTYKKHESSSFIGETFIDIELQWDERRYFKNKDKRYKYGRVVRNDSLREGIPAVQIAITNGSETTKSDSSGNYDLEIKNERFKENQELLFTKLGYITAKKPLKVDGSVYTSKHENVNRDIVKLKKFSENPSKRLTFKFSKIGNEPLPSVFLLVNDKFVGKSDDFGILHLAFGGSRTDSIHVNYVYTIETEGAKSKAFGDTIIAAYEDEKTIHFKLDTKGHFLNIDLFSDSIDSPLSKQKVYIDGREYMTDENGSIKYHADKAQDEIVISKEGYRTVRAPYKIEGVSENVLVVLKSKRLEVTVLKSGKKSTPVENAEVIFGDVSKSTNGDGKEVFDKPIFPNKLSVHGNDTYIGWEEDLIEERSSLPIWLKQKPEPLKPVEITVYDKSNTTRRLRPVLYSASSHVVSKIDTSERLLLYDTKRKDIISVGAVQYKSQEIEIDPEDSPYKIPLKPDTVRFEQPSKTLAGFLGATYWCFDDTNSNSGGEKNSMNLSLAFEKSFFIDPDSSGLKKFGLRPHFLLQLPLRSPRLTNLDLGADLLFNPFRGLGVHVGLLATFYDLNPINDGIGNSWLTPFVSFGIEADNIINILSVRCTYSAMVIDHYALSSSEFKLKPLRNSKAPWRRFHLSATAQVSRNTAIRLDYIRYNSQIHGRGTALEDISSFAVWFGFKL